MAEKGVLERLEAAIAARRGADRRRSYVASLNAKGLDAILKKIGEEATEAVIAAKSGEREAIVHETADLWFHCLVMLAWHGVAVAEVLAELERREGRSGIEEKASRRRRTRMTDCIFCKIVARRDPEPQGLRGRRHARLPRHQSAGARALHDHPQEPRRLARHRGPASMRRCSGRMMAMAGPPRARAGLDGRLPHHREHRSDRQAGRVSFAHPHHRRPRSLPRMIARE